jgi:hypothetical protein
MKISKALTQAYQLQDLAFQEASALRQLGATIAEPELRARVAASFSQVVRSWETCVERSRIIRGRPLPGSLRPDRKPSRALCRWRDRPEPETVEPEGPEEPATESEPAPVA